MSSTKLWGAIAVGEEVVPPIPPQDLEIIMKPRQIEVEGPVLHQPSCKPTPPSNELHSAQFSSTDPLTLHTIRLLQYSRRMRVLIANMQAQFEQLENGAHTQFNPPPPIPQYEGPTKKHISQTPVPFLNKDLENKFARGIGVAPPEVDKNTCRKLLKNSVAAILAHSGFDVCSESTLETLVDATHEYMLKFTECIRQARDNEALNGSCGFPDVMERAFHDMGQGSMLGLHDFYQTKVVKYNAHLLRTCELLREDYLQLQNADASSFATLKLACSSTVSDIEFSLIDETDDDFDSCVPLEATIWPGIGMNALSDGSTSQNADIPAGEVKVKEEVADPQLQSPRSFEQPLLKKKRT